jgi:hypothetical protein
LQIDSQTNPLPPHAEILKPSQAKTLKMRFALLNVQKQDVQTAENLGEFLLLFSA